MINWQIIIFPVFFALTFLVFFLRDVVLSLYRFRKVIGITSGILTIVSIAFLQSFIIHAGTTIKIDSSDGAVEAVTSSGLVAERIWTALLITQIVLILAVLRMAFVWGKQRARAA